MNQKLACVAIVLGLCACDDSKSAAESAPKDAPKEAKADAAPVVKKLEADAEPPALAKVEHPTLGFAIDLPDNYEVKRSDDKQVVYAFALPDKYTPKVTVRRETFEIKGDEKAIRQHARDSMFGPIDSISKREDGAFFVLSKAKTVAKQERQKLRVYIGSLYAECGGRANYMDSVSYTHLTLPTTPYV